MATENSNASSIDSSAALRAQAAPPGEPGGAAHAAGASSDEASTGVGGPRPAPPAAARPNYVLLGGIAALVLFADWYTKRWAVEKLSELPTQSEVVIEGVLSYTLAYNKGGAFSMGAGVDDTWRAPFFLIVGLVAVGFIISLYRKLHPEQWALRYGLPLVLGGALGNLLDRVTKGKVVDFIDYRASWVELMNSLIAKVQSSWHVTDHWPTFNIADVCICVGIGLIALDMFQSGKGNEPAAEG